MNSLSEIEPIKKDEFYCDECGNDNFFHLHEVGENDNEYRILCINCLDEIPF